MIIQTFIAAEGQIYQLLKIFRNLFIKSKIYINKSNVKNMGSMLLESQEELGLDYNLDIFKLYEINNLDKQEVKDFFAIEFNIKHYSVCKKLHEKLKNTILKLKTKKFSELQLDTITYATYKLIDNANMNLHWLLTLPSREPITILENIICSLEQSYFNAAKEMLEPIVSKVYFKLAIVLFPYLKQSSDHIIATKNLFNKSAIGTFIDRSLYFTVSLLRIEQKLKDPANIIKFQSIKQETIVEIANIKRKLKNKQKKFFLFLIDVIEEKVFYILQDGGNMVIKFNKAVNDLNLYIFTKLNKLFDLYFQIFMIKKIVDNCEKNFYTKHLGWYAQLKEVVQDDFDLYFRMFTAKNTISSIIDESEKLKPIELLNTVEPIKAFTQEEILDFLNFSLKSYNTKNDVVNSNSFNHQENKESIKHKIIRIFPDLPKPKQDLLISMLEEEDLTITNYSDNNTDYVFPSQQKASPRVEELTSSNSKENVFVHSPYSYYKSIGWQETAHKETESNEPTLNNYALSIRNRFK